MTIRAIATKLQPSSRVNPRRWSRLLEYGVAVIAVVTALSTTLLLYPLLQDTPASLFYVAVMVTSWLGGLGPGLLATGLSTVVLNYFFLETHNSFTILEPKTVFQLIVFATANILVSYLNETRLVARQRADTNLKAWRESEAQFTHLAEANVIGIFKASLNGRLIEANDALLNMLGYTREDLLAGRIDWNELTPSECQAVSNQSQQELYTTGVCTPYEREYIRKDGFRIPMLLGSVRQDEQSIVGFVLDRSEFRRNELEQLKLNQQLQEKVIELQTLLDVIPIGIGIAEDRDCKRIRVNPAFAKLLNISTSENASLTASEAERPKTFKVYRNGREMAPQDLPLQYAAEHGVAVHELEVEVVWQDGTVVTLLEYAVPLLDQTGQPRGSIGAFLDLTDRKRAEAEREALLQQEQAARAEAEQANRIKDEFLAVLSHELRSPLNPILGWTKLLQNRSFDAEKTALALATIERNAKLLAQLIEDLLDISRILQGKMVLNRCPVNLVKTIEAAIETVRLAAETKGLQIQTELAPDARTVVGDAARLQQVIWNLLVNAVKFTPQGGHIEIRLFYSDGFAQIQVQDTGKGINPEFLPHAFDYFRQEDGAITRRFGGLGLGLALAQRLIHQHGGTIVAESDGEGQGSTFTLRLPLQTAVPVTDEASLQQLIRNSGDSQFSEGV